MLKMKLRYEKCSPKSMNLQKNCAEYQKNNFFEKNYKKDLLICIFYDKMYFNVI